MILGDKGRIIIPAGVRERRRWTQGTTLILQETAQGLLLTDRDTALRMIRHTLAGRSLVDDLVEERRAEAQADQHLS